jgi:hypothetical protein
VGDEVIDTGVAAIILPKLEGHATQSWSSVAAHLQILTEEVFSPALQSFLSSNSLQLRECLEHLHFPNLCTTKSHLDTLFLVNVYNGYKFCPSLLETAGIHVLSRYFKDFPLFPVGTSRKNCPSAR